MGTQRTGERRSSGCSSRRGELQLRRPCAPLAPTATTPSTPWRATRAPCVACEPHRCVTRPQHSTSPRARPKYQAALAALGVPIRFGPLCFPAQSGQEHCASCCRRRTRGRGLQVQVVAPRRRSCARRRDAPSARSRCARGYLVPLQLAQRSSPSGTTHAASAAATPWPPCTPKSP